MKTDQDRQRFTDLIARHDAFFFFELPMLRAAISEKTSALNHAMEMRRLEAVRKRAEEDASFNELLANLYAARSPSAGAEGGKS